MSNQILATSFSIASAVLVTVAISACFADSEASMQAGSQSSTLNSSQGARETTTQAVSQNNSQSANEQNSHASSQNGTQSLRQAPGTLNPGMPIAPTAISPTSKSAPKAVVRNYGGHTSSTISTSRTSTLNGHHVAMHSYRWNRGHKRTFSKGYMNQTILQAARTR